MKKSAYFLVAVFLLASLCSGINIANAAEPIKLKAVNFLPLSIPVQFFCHEWVKRINQELKGKVHVDLLGGPEVIPGMEQVEAIRNNVVHVGFEPTAYYEPIMPEGRAFSLLRLTPTELLKSGFHDFMVKRHEKIGVRYLGLYNWGQFYLYTKKPVKTLDDLKGLKMRTASLYDRFMRALGMVPVSVPYPEIHTALQRGTVDGQGWFMDNIARVGWADNLRYLIDHPFFSMNTVIIMNLSTWNKLPKSVQDKIIKVTEKIQGELIARMKQMYVKNWEANAKAGVKKIYFSPEEAKIYTDTAYRVEWEYLEKKVPDLVPKLKEMTGN